MSQLERYIIYVISPFLLMTVFYSMMVNTGGLGWLYVPIILVAILTIYMELFILPNPALTRRFWLLLICLGLCNLFIGLFETGSTYHIYNYLLLFALMRYKGRGKVGILLAIDFIVIGVVIAFKMPISEVYFTTYLSWIRNYSIVFLGLSILHYMIIQNQELMLAKKQLIEKNLDLSYAYEQLKRAYDDLEDFTIMKERNNMSREMHDTVGHTLTTSLVELELCKMLGKDNEELMNKLEHISSQVRKGLGDLRMTVRRLKEDLDWEQEIYAIGERLNEYTDIKVKYIVGELTGISTQILRCVYRIIQEGITNGIKHGKATAFMIEVKREEKHLWIEILDNGLGAIAFKQGFGLNAMRERVEALGGTLHFESYKDEGFTIQAQIPLEE
ncbi:sensor histidine kinase [Cellulosilyticum lentocellum]|uniref:histidine kinase n=1 Tax=Cellulosilyticum lentocellum (strain ATCC 49066 / DSM 5427 / NCIMB 11756 / RHM5) TaxID=642492 RepID=F2JP94_CELLD|nr:sensor histidine kinase [Cellulosilyticum lentocellum]ADZ84833.1 integral membrane sensor signal transduction histidine kinase [Cellulosilyticum lentocellum DSM 5427]